MGVLVQACDGCVGVCVMGVLVQVCDGCVGAGV